MTAETAILRAYALASEGKFEEAEALLKSSLGVLSEPSGIDLLARIRREQGDVESARRLWESVLRLAPDYVDAQTALEALVNPMPLEDAEDRRGSQKPLLFVSGLALTLFVMVLALLSRACRTSESGSAPICMTNFVPRIERIEVPVTNKVTEVKVVTNEVKKLDVRTEIVKEVVTNEVPVVEYRDRVVTNDIERIVYRDSVFTNMIVKTNVVVCSKCMNVVPVLPQINRRFETPYVIKEGDMVSALAVRYNFRLPDFKALNPGVNPDVIRVGQRVLLPGDHNVEEE